MAKVSKPSGPQQMRGNVIAYARVSTDQQSAENQRPDLEQMAKARGWSISRWYVDEAVSGRAAVRPAFDEMMADAKRGRFRVLLIWSLDRFGRQMVRTIGDVLELDRLGVQIVSVKEPWLDQQGPARSLLLAVLSWVAEQEAVRLSERTLAGLARAKAKGRVGGRPRVASQLINAALARVAAGESIAAAAEWAKVHPNTLRRYRTENGDSRRALDRAWASDSALLLLATRNGR